MTRVQAEVDPLESLEAVNQQPGTRESDDSERRLYRDERLLKTASLACTTTGPRVDAKWRRQAAASDRQARRHPEEQRRQEGDHPCGQDRRSGERNILETRQLRRRGD